MCLAVFRTVASHVEEELCQFEIPLLAGCIIEFYQAHLYYLVAGIVNVEIGFVPSEIAIDKVCRLDCYIEELSLAGCLVVCYSCFVEVSHIVELMAEIVCADPSSPLAPGVNILFTVYRTVGVEVAVVLLGHTYFIYKGVDVGFELRIWIGL